MAARRDAHMERYEAMSRESDAELVSAVRAALATSVATLEPQVLDGLRQARQRALLALPADRAPAPSRLRSVFALAATIVIAIGAWQHVVVPPLPAITDGAEALAAQDVDLLENLEFVAWLVAEEADVPG